jgi:hypothetical protein
MAAENRCTDSGNECLLRADHVGSEFAANLLVRLMAGDDVSQVMRGRPRLVPGKQCVECAQRVMQDLAPLKTAEQWGEEAREGKRSNRRQRRRSQHEARSEPTKPFFR